MLNAIKIAIISLVLTLFSCTSQRVNSPKIGNDFKEKEKQLTSIYSQLNTYFRGNYDSLSYYSNLFSKEFKQFIAENPSTIAYPFDSLKSNHSCNIVTAADGKFRIYSWDTWLGGTMHFYENIYQYNTIDGVKVRYNEGKEGDPNSYYSHIYYVVKGDTTFYLSLSNGVFSTSQMNQTIENFTINNGELVDTTNLFKTSSRGYPSIGFSYNFFSVMDREERPLRLIVVDEKNRRVLIPIVIGEGEVTNRFIVYQWDGNQFVHRFTDKEER